MKPEKKRANTRDWGTGIGSKERRLWKPGPRRRKGRQEKKGKNTGRWTVLNDPQQPGKRPGDKRKRMELGQRGGHVYFWVEIPTEKNAAGSKNTNKLS